LLNGEFEGILKKAALAYWNLFGGSRKNDRESLSG
jgi:hypothetical protein